MLVGKDSLVDKLWNRRGSLGKRLREAGFHTIVPPAFSPYWENPPLDGHMAIKMTAQMTVDLSRHVNVIPTIEWRTRADIERFAAWIKRGNVNCIAVHLSTRVSREWDRMLEETGYLGQILGPRMHLVAIGPSRISRIQRVSDTWPGRLTIASGRPWQLAKDGQLLHADLTDTPASRRTNRSELAGLNASTFAQVVEQLTRYPRLRGVSGL